ncbi:hypothetical protein C8R47DRAFT_1205332 [Mycena vitilis]|nr:hypothetical protein C8R47DRAFT_1205332 [Mycena vitilis]
MRDPGDYELFDWMQDHKALTIPALRAFAAARDDPWRVSSKRLRTFRNDKIVNIASVAASSVTTREALTLTIRVAHLPGLAGAAGLTQIVAFMQDPDPFLLGALYESNRDTINWYYEVYCSKGDQPPNAFASAIFKRDVRGPITVVKNGPVASVFDAAMERAELAKALWYYYKSGMDPKFVASERVLERMLVG